MVSGRSGVYFSLYTVKTTVLDTMSLWEDIESFLSAQSEVFSAQSWGYKIMQSLCPKTLLGASTRQHFSWSLVWHGPTPVVQSADSWRRGAPSFMLVNSMNGLRYQETTASGRLWATARTKGITWRGRWGWKISAPLQLSRGMVRAAFLSQIMPGWATLGYPGLLVPFIFWSHYYEGPLRRTLRAYAVESEIQDSNSTSTFHIVCDLGQHTRRYL